ncbi:MAG: hypothetical protein V4615_01185 [Bacteroidota bacterium]
MKIFLLFLFPSLGFSQLSQFNFYESKNTSEKTDTTKKALSVPSLTTYPDTGIIMWSADTIHWIPSGGIVLGKEISGYYFDSRTKSYLRK